MESTPLSSSWLKPHCLSRLKSEERASPSSLAERDTHRQLQRRRVRPLGLSEGGLLEGEVPRLQPWALPQQQGAVHHVAQLADVARPVVLLQLRQRGRGEFRRMPRRRAGPHEVLGQQPNVPVTSALEEATRWMNSTRCRTAGSVPTIP